MSRRSIEPKPARVQTPTSALGTPAPNPLSEVEARKLLADRFRAAGFRIRYDFRLRFADVDVTLDGFDPLRQVGFEYLAAEELDLDVTTAERRAVARSGVRVMFVDPSDAPTVTRMVRAFLDNIPAAATSP